MMPNNPLWLIKINHNIFSLSLVCECVLKSVRQDAKEISEKVLSLRIHYYYIRMSERETISQTFCASVHIKCALCCERLTREENLRFICKAFKLFKMASWN